MLQSDAQFKYIVQDLSCKVFSKAIVSSRGSFYIGNDCDKTSYEIGLTEFTSTARYVFVQVDEANDC